MKEIAYQTLGRNLREKREQMGLSLQEVAWRARVNLGNLSKLECGKGQPFSTDSLLRLANVYGISPRGILALAGKPEPYFSDVRLSIEALQGLIEEMLPTTEDQLVVAAINLDTGERSLTYKPPLDERIARQLDGMMSEFCEGTDPVIVGSGRTKRTFRKISEYKGETVHEIVYRREKR